MWTGPFTTPILLICSLLVTAHRLNPLQITQFMTACKYGDISAVVKLLPAADDEQIVPSFILAIQHQQIPVVQHLLPLKAVQNSLEMSDEAVRAALTTKNLELLRIIANEMTPKRRCEMTITSCMSSDIQVLQVLYPIFSSAPLFIVYLAFYSHHNKRLDVIEWALKWESIVYSVPLQDRFSTIVTNIDNALEHGDQVQLETYMRLLLCPLYRESCTASLQPAIAKIVTFQILNPFMAGLISHELNVLPEIFGKIAYLLYQSLLKPSPEGHEV